MLVWYAQSPRFSLQCLRGEGRSMEVQGHSLLYCRFEVQPGLQESQWVVVSLEWNVRHLESLPIRYTRRLVRHISCCVCEWIYRENWPKAKTLMGAGWESDEIKGKGREILLAQTSCLSAPCLPWSELLCLAMFSRPRWNRNPAIMGQYTSSSLNYVFSGVTVMTSDQHKLGSHFLFPDSKGCWENGW